MKTVEENNPPVSVEQWLDVVIASAAHRSHVEEQRSFGNMLIQRYFVSLPERYQDDKVAARYFDDMLCAVASAIRGFSVVRDTFQTNCDSFKAAQESNLEYAKNIDKLSPLKPDGHWGQVIAAVIGIGLGTPISKAVQECTKTSSLVSIFFVVGFTALVLVGFQALVEWFRNTQLRRFQQQFPHDLLSYWSDYSMNGYRKVLKQFLPIAVEITERFYPNAESTPRDTENRLDEVVERHFAFKSATKKNESSE